MFMRIEVLDVVHRLKQHDKYLVVRFLALVTTMVTKVDHGNHCSNVVNIVVIIVVTMMVTMVVIHFSSKNISF